MEIGATRSRRQNSCFGLGPFPCSLLMSISRPFISGDHPSPLLHPPLEVEIYIYVTLCINVFSHFRSTQKNLEILKIYLKCIACLFYLHSNTYLFYQTFLNTLTKSQNLWLRGICTLYFTKMVKSKHPNIV